MQTDYPKLNFPSIKLKIKQNEGDKTISVWVPMRKKFLNLTPEEWVRRHTVSYLTTHCGVECEHICEEYPVAINGQAQRADIVVFNRKAKPWLLVECKAPTVAITREVFSQAIRYNSIIGAQYLILTNGLTHFCYELKDSHYTPLKSFPTL